MCTFLQWWNWQARGQAGIKCFRIPTHQGRSDQNSTGRGQIEPLVAASAAVPMVTEPALGIEGDAFSDRSEISLVSFHLEQH